MIECPKRFYKNGMIVNHNAWLSEVEKRKKAEIKIKDLERALKAIHQKYWNLRKVKP
jgi:hypothetical protein